MVQFGGRLPLQPHDPDDLVIQDLKNIIARYIDLGLQETVDIYQAILTKKEAESV